MKPLFLIPGQGETLRVNGRCLLNNDPELCEELVVNGKTPRVVLVVSVESVCTGTWSRGCDQQPEDKVFHLIEAYPISLPEDERAVLAAALPRGPSRLIRG